jgi:DNA-binding GntR family transcriptional regulator
MRGMSTPIHPSSLNENQRVKTSEKIRFDIERLLESGELLPGDPIDEAQLAARYNVSRTPIREALLHLRAQGLVDAQPRSGIVAAKMDVQQLLAMWELLSELEGLCARFACERMTDAERAALVEHHRAAARVVDADDAEGWQDANLAFHEMLYHGSRNPYLRQEILRMRTRTGAYRRHAFGAVNRIQASYLQHEQVVLAIAAGDSSAAALAMRDHLSPEKGARSVTDLIVTLPRSMLN